MSAGVRRVVVTGMMVVMVRMVMMAREGWQRDHGHHDEKQQQLFHAGIIAANCRRAA
jgi:hypothetical protein